MLLPIHIPASRRGAFSLNNVARRHRELLKRQLAAIYRAKLEIFHTFYMRKRARRNSSVVINWDNRVPSQEAKKSQLARSVDSVFGKLAKSFSFVERLNTFLPPVPWVLDSCSYTTLHFCAKAGKTKNNNKTKHKRKQNIPAGLFQETLLFSRRNIWESEMIGSHSFISTQSGPFQTSNFSCAESNANEKNLLFSLICIRFGTCKVRRLKGPQIWRYKRKPTS